MPSSSNGCQAETGRIQTGRIAETELPPSRRPCEDQHMSTVSLAELLRLPSRARAELAMALWESLSDTAREEALELTDDQRAELDRRWDEHLENPNSGIPWSEVRSKLI